VKVFANFPHELPERAAYAVATVGVFDGLHRGHQSILRAAVQAARDAAAALAVVTFDPHPRAVLGPPKRARMLSPLEERLELLQEWPVDAVAVLRFDQQVARLSYVDFVRRILVHGLGVQRLVLGYNVRFGRDREGTQERISSLGEQLGYGVLTVPPLEDGGEPISSTRIRHALDAGRVSEASRLLGRAYSLEGTVIRGSGRGRALGLPTANLALPPDKLVPADGVYAVRAQVGGQRVPGALNIGTAPTFESGGKRSVEVHLLDYTGDLYGSRLRLQCVERLREERKFPGADALLAQVRVDLAEARRRLSAPASDLHSDD
jgi:riboflavin kinase/FMN adenylyltransferase